MTILCAQCSARLEEDAAVCVHCGGAVEEVAQPATDASLALPADSTNLIAPEFAAETQEIAAPTFRIKSDLEGIGGWLILPALGLAAGPFLFLHGVYSDITILFGSKYQLALATQHLLAGLIVFEGINNLILLASTVCLNLLFYAKRRLFPTYMVVYLCGQFLLGLIEQLLALQFNPRSDWMLVLRSFGACLIWIPYFLRSERVKETFVQ